MPRRKVTVEERELRELASSYDWDLGPDAPAQGLEESEGIGLVWSGSLSVDEHTALPVVDDILRRELRDKHRKRLRIAKVENSEAVHCRPEDLAIYVESARRAFFEALKTLPRWQGPSESEVCKAWDEADYALAQGDNTPAKDLESLREKLYKLLTKRLDTHAGAVQGSIRQLDELVAAVGWFDTLPKATIAKPYRHDGTLSKSDRYWARRVNDPKRQVVDYVHHKIPKPRKKGRKELVDVRTSMDLVDQTPPCAGLISSAEEEKIGREEGESGLHRTEMSGVFVKRGYWQSAEDGRFLVNKDGKQTEIGVRFRWPTSHWDGQRVIDVPGGIEETVDLPESEPYTPWVPHKPMAKGILVNDGGVRLTKPTSRGIWESVLVRRDGRWMSHDGRFRPEPELISLGVTRALEVVDRRVMGTEVPYDGFFQFAHVNGEMEVVRHHPYEKETIGKNTGLRVRTYKCFQCSMTLRREASPHVRDTVNLVRIQPALVPWWTKGSVGIRKPLPIHGSSGEWRCLMHGTDAITSEILLDVTLRLKREETPTRWHFRLRVFGSSFMRRFLNLSSWATPENITTYREWAHNARLIGKDVFRGNYWVEAS